MRRCQPHTGVEEERGAKAPKTSERRLLFSSSTYMLATEATLVVTLVGRGWDEEGAHGSFWG